MGRQSRSVTVVNPVYVYVPFTEVLIQKYFTPSAMNHLSRLPLIFSLNVTNFEFLSFGWPSDEP